MNRHSLLAVLALGMCAVTMGAVVGSAGAVGSSSSSATIAFIGGDGEVHAVNEDGSNEHAVTHASQFARHTGTSWVAWSPDGTRLVLWREDNKFERGQIYVVNGDGTHARQVARGSWPAWSPDGTEIAYVSRTHGQVLVVRADGSHRRRLTPGGQAVMTHVPETNPLVWAPGHRIVFESVKHGLLSVNPATGIERSLTPNGVLGYFASPSPDGKRVAFVESPPDYSTREIVVVAENGGSARRVTRGAQDMFPSWSPGGKRLTFTRRLGRQLSVASDEVYTVSVSTRVAHRRTTNRVVDGFPEWSPDGSAIAYVHGGKTDAGIHLMTLGGTKRRVVADGFTRPMWRPTQR